MPSRKRKRGRPPKERILSETDSENQTPDHGRSTSFESTGKNSTKKKRRRRSADDAVPSELATRLLLLEHNIAPVGMTRQASKELALVSMRKKHDGETAAISNSEGASLPREVASSAESKRDCFSKLEIEEKDDFEVIEISSLSTDDEETLTSSQESRAATIVISSQSDSESESGKKDATVTHAEEMTKGEAFVEETSSENTNEKDNKTQNNAIVPLESGVAKLKRILSSDSYRSVDISLNNNGKAVSEIEQREDFVERTAMSCEPLEKDDLNDHAMDVNSNLTAKTSAVGSNLSLSEKHTGGKILASYETTVRIEWNDEEFPGTTTTSSSKSSGGKLSVDKLQSTFESTDDRKVTNDMASSETKRLALSQLDSIASAPKRRGDKIVANTGKAKRTSGRPKSIRDHRKRLPSLDDAPGLKRDSSVSKKTAMFIAESEAGKIERQTLASTTADLLPMQNKTTAVPLMDGDLIGMIIQDNQKVDESKKTQTATESGKKEGKTRVNGHSETLKFKPWDSGMEDISDGEDDLSDFEFDLDDYSPSSFFNDVEESNTIERTPSPEVEPLNLSSAALKHAIREGDIAQVRGALAVPGLNQDPIDTVSGMNLLTLAATYGQDEIVKLLLRRGAGVNYTDQNRNGMTALIQAAEQGFPKTVQVLLESGAHINCQTTAGETALMRACKKGHKNVVEVFLRHGVDTKAQSTHELTAKQIALKNKHFEIQNLLADHETSLANTLQVALGKCLGTAGTLCLPMLMPYRCIAPGEVESVNFLVKHNPNRVPQGSKVVLFCVRADFNKDEVCLSFGSDNGVRGVLFNDSIQYPLVQGNRSVYLLTLDADVLNNVLIVQTHFLKSARLIVCVAFVTARGES